MSLTLTRDKFPLSPGEHPVIYITTDKGQNILIQATLLVNNAGWLLVQEWHDHEDGKVSPGQWIELPMDCAYQLMPIAGKQGVFLPQPIDIQVAKKNLRKTVIFPSPPEPPQS